MSDDPTEHADRLEAALERIAMLANRPRPSAAIQPAAPIQAEAAVQAEPPGNAELAARLDSLIAQLRATLSHTGA